jgi:hypothetical protein
MAGKGARDESGLVMSRVANATDYIIDLHLLLFAFALFDIYSGGKLLLTLFIFSSLYTPLLNLYPNLFEIPTRESPRTT